MDTTIKRLLFVFLFVGAFMLSWNSCGFAAYTIDGLLSDWGITPFSDWTPWDSSVDFTEEDWTKSPHYSGYIGTGDRPMGGEKYDIEALFFDDDPNFVYLAMVTSYPFSSKGSGDIAIGFGDSGDFGFGLQTKGLSTYGHNYIPITKLLEGEDWEYCGNPDCGPVYLANNVGQDIGLAEIYYWNATYGSGPYNEPGTSTHTWVLEAKMDRLLFDGLAQDGEIIRLHHSMQCCNDCIDVKGDFEKTIIPEPASLGLLGLGILGIAFIGRKRRGAN